MSGLNQYMVNIVNADELYVQEKNRKFRNWRFNNI